jgi:hypothetical protein
MRQGSHPNRGRTPTPALPDCGRPLLAADAARWHVSAACSPGHQTVPARPPRAGQLTLARTCVLIKTASLPHCTCVLIICMSLASHGRWPRSDVTSGCRQNGARLGQSALCGVAGHCVTRSVQPCGLALPGAGSPARSPQCSARTAPAARAAAGLPDRSRRPHCWRRAAQARGRASCQDPGHGWPPTTARGRAPPAPARPAVANSPKHCLAARCYVTEPDMPSSGRIQEGET